MWIRLPKTTLIQLYSHCREAERSVDAALWTKWCELTNYYAVNKTATIRQMIEDLNRELPDRHGRGSGCTRDELTGAVPTPGLLRVLFGKWIGGIKTAWPFLPQELHFFASTLDRLLQYLSVPEKPSQDQLIALRMDLHACEYVIECRCYGLPELAQAQRIGHFNQSSPVGLVKVTDHVRSDDRTPMRIGRS